MSEEAIAVKLAYITDSVDELKLSLTKLLERDEIRMQKISDFELQMKLTEKDEQACKLNVKKEFDAVHEKIREIENNMPTVEKSRESMGKWVDFWLKLGAIIALISGALVGFVYTLIRAGLLKG